jgi:hypothetical protein
MKVTATCNGFGLLMVTPVTDQIAKEAHEPSTYPCLDLVGVLPAVNILLAFLVSAILFYYLDINPVDAAEIMWYGAFGTGEGSVSPLLRDRLHLHRSGGGGGLPRRPVQHRWRRAGLYRRPWRRSGLSAAG